MSPILFGKHLSTAFNAWLARPIPMLPATELATGLNFDGKDDHVEFAPVDWSYPQFTIEAFVTSTLRSDNGITVSLTSGGRPWELMELYDGPHTGSGQRQSGAQIMGKTPYATAYGPLTPGVRQHRALVFDGSHMHYYINGIWQGKRRAEAYEGMRWKMWKMKQLRLGSDGDGKKLFEGQIDQVRISKVARYTDNFAPVTSVASDDQTLALYDFAEGSGDVLKDISGHGHDGKIVGATWSDRSRSRKTSADPSEDGRSLTTSATTPPSGAASASGKAEPTDSTNPDRALAEWVIFKGGSVQLDGQTGTIDKASDLPTEAFQLNIITLTAPNCLTDADFERLRGLQKLAFIDVYETHSGVTDDGFRRLADVIPPSVTTLVFSGNLPNVTDAVVEDLNRMVHLKTLHLIAPQMTNAGLEKLNLPNLWGLGLSHCQATLLGLKDAKARLPLLHIVQFRRVAIPTAELSILSQWNLDHLALQSAGIQDQDLPLLPSHSSLGVLDLQGNQGVTDDGVPHLLAFQKLSYLNLESTSVGDAGMSHVKALPELVRLNANYLPLTDAGIASISEITKLQRLHIVRNTGITDVALEHLAKCLTLKILHIQECLQLTEAGVRKLSVALPGCKIEWDGGVIESIATGWHGWPADAPAPAIAPFDAEQAKQHQEAWAKYLGVPVEYTNSLGMKFRLIPPGEFTMGSTKDEIAAALKDVGEHKHWQECIQSEAPQHTVILTQPIYLSVNEVKQAEYEKVMGANPSHFSPLGMGKEAVAGMETTDHPVEMVNWNDAAEFCAKLSKQEKLKPFYFRAGETITPLDGTGYRLPSEAEWEIACRAGTVTKYWIGDKDEDLVRTGWFGGNAGGRTHAAGELKANPFGLYDIHGNVWEWVQDGWDATYYGQFSEKLAINPNSPFSAGSRRVIRGGVSHNSASDCRSSNRRAYDPAGRGGDIGFRVSLPVDAVRQALKVTGPTMPKPVATPPSALASDPIDFAAERQAAEWAIEAKARFDIDAAGQIIPVTDVAQLPNGPFHIQTLAFTPQSTFQPNDFERIGQLRGLIWLGFEEPLTDGSCLVEVGKVKSLQGLNLTRAQIADAHLSALIGLKNLTELDLMFTPIGDAGMGAVAQLTSLKTLHLGESHVGDEGLAQLKTLDRLETLGLGTLMTDQGLGQLASFPKLTTVLGLKSHHLTEVGIGHLQKSPHVTYLNVVQATDADLVRLKPLAHVTAWSFNLHQLSASGLEALGEFPKLDYLILGGHPNFDDSYLTPLAKLTTLRKLYLQDVKVTAAGIAQFREQRPEVLLDVNGQEYPAVQPERKLCGFCHIR